MVTNKKGEGKMAKTQKVGRPAAPKNEDKSAKFRRVATARAEGLVRNLRTIGKLGNENLYSYSEEDVEKLFGFINDKVNEARGRFFNGKAESHKVEIF